MRAILGNVVHGSEVNIMTTKTSDTVIREMIEKALTVYDLPEMCIRIALAFIDGLKVGTAQSSCGQQSKLPSTERFER